MGGSEEGTAHFFRQKAMKSTLLFFDSIDNEIAQKKTAYSKAGHDKKDNAVPGKTFIAVQYAAVNSIHERPRQIADEGPHRHSGTGDFSGNLNLVHGSEENSSHTEYAGADTQSNGHAKKNAHGLVRQEGETRQSCRYNNKYDTQVFGCRVKYFVG